MMSSRYHTTVQAYAKANQRWNYATPSGVLTFKQLAIPLELADLDLKESVPDLKHPHFRSFGSQ